jgi:hypothetical protein
VREALAHPQDGAFTVECAMRLSEDLDRPSRSGIAAVCSTCACPITRVSRASNRSGGRRPTTILVISSPDDQNIASALVIAVKGAIVFARRRPSDDLGSVSASWTTEHNAGYRGGDRRSS